MFMASTQENEGATWLRTVLIGRKPQRTLVRIVVLVAVCFVVFRFVLLPIRVEGMSMLPAYKDNRVNFVNRLAYVFHRPERRDVVAIKTSGISIMYMKRIIGLPGETVAFHKGRAMINGKLLDEPYVRSSCDWELPPRILGKNEYYFVGDNRGMPEADHYKGAAVRRKIVGKVLL